jgi:hypothetical protein
MRRMPSLLLWILLGVGIVLVPIACSSSNSGDDAGNHTDVAQHADALTKT